MGNTKFKKAKSRSLGPRNVSVKTNNYTLRNNLITATHKLKTKRFSEGEETFRVRLHDGKHKWSSRSYLCESKTIKQYTYLKPVLSPG